MSTLAERIRNRMLVTGLTNAQLAAACQVKPPTSFNWASGKTKAIKGEPLLLAAKALGVTPEWLATGSRHPYPPKVVSNANFVSESITAYNAGSSSSWPFVLVDQMRYSRLSEPQQHQAQVRMMDEIISIEKAIRANGTHN